MSIRYRDMRQAGSAPLVLVALLTCAAMVGCTRQGGQGPGGKTGASGSQPVIAVGFIGPLSGDAASFGVSQKTGIELAANELNARGGITGKAVKVVFEDSQLDQNKAITAFNKLVDSDKAQVILGETSSANTLAIGPLAQRKGVLLVSPIASAADLTRSGFRMFRVSPSDSFQAKVAAQFAQGKRWKTAAVLYTNDAWGSGLMEGFTSDFTSLGGKILTREAVEPKTQDLKTQLTKIKSLAPDVVYIPLHPDEAIVAFRQAAQLGLRTAFLGADSFSEPTVREAAGDAVNGVTYTVPAPGSGEVFRRFAEAYKAKYGTEPNYNAAAAYDSVMVLAEAAKSARSIDAAGLADALAGVKGFQGASGLISFDANGDVVSKAYDIMRIEHGKPIVSQSGVTVK